MAKKGLPIGFIIGGVVVAGGIAAVAASGGGRKGSGKSKGTSADTAAPSGPGAPILDEKGKVKNPPPMLDPALVSEVLGVQWDLMNALGYAGPFPPGTNVEGFDGPSVETVQIKRFQAHYNTLSKNAGSTFAGRKVPGDMGTLEVTGTLDDPTLRALVFAGFSGGPEYSKEQLIPYIKGESDLLTDTDWLNMVLEACDKEGVGICADWIRQGAQPTWGMVQKNV